MKKLMAAAVLAASFASAAMPTHAATTYLKFTGHIKHTTIVDDTLPAEAGGTGGGKTELGNRCQPGGNLAGEDGMWFALPTGDDKTDKLPAKLSFDFVGVQNVDPGRNVPVLGAHPSALRDMDAYFFKADCTDTGFTGMAQSSNPEMGAVPKDAAFVLVNYYYGPDDIDFTLEIGTPAA